MKAAILPSRGGGEARPLTGEITNSFPDFGKLWDEGWVVYSREVMKNEEVLADMDLVFCELTWADSWQSQMIEFKKRHPDKPKVVCFTGSASRFYINCNPIVYPIHVQALAAIDGLGTMNEDMLWHYRNWGANNVFHMPCMINADYYRKQLDGKKDENLHTLSMHTDLFTDPSAKRADMSNLFLWKGLSKYFSGLRGITWCNKNEHHLSKQGGNEDMIADLDTVIRGSGITNVEVRFASRNFTTITGTSKSIVHLNNFHCQSRVSQFGSAIGVPVIAPDMNETHRRLFPDLAPAWNRHDQAMRMFKQLLKSEEFYRSVVDYASEAVEYYSPESSRERIVKALGL